MEKNNVKNLLILNFAMICISTSGAIGRYITLPPPITIWYRALFALLFLGLFCYLKKFRFAFNIKDDGSIIFLSGALMAVHWITYFYALQWSNVAIGMLSLFTFPIMTTLLEPLFLNTKWQPFHLLMATLILIGVFLLAPDLNINNTMNKGLLIGLLSAFCYSIRNLILKKRIEKFNGSILMFYQMLITLILLIPVFFIFENDSKVLQDQFTFLIFLGLITTAIGHTLFLNSFKKFSVSTVSILSGMQPIFGIIIAVIFLKEIPAGRSLIGGALIILTVLLESRRSFKKVK